MQWANCLAMLGEVIVEECCAGKGAFGKEFGYAITLVTLAVPSLREIKERMGMTYSFLRQRSAPEEGFRYCDSAEFAFCNGGSEILDGAFCDFDLFGSKHLLGQREGIEWDVFDFWDCG